MTLSRSLRLALTLAAAVACTDSGEEPQPPAPPRGIVVLNGFGDPGLTLLADTGTASTHVGFEPFDGSTFSLEGDTLLTTASKWAGSLLYVADARTGDFASIQLPVNSNPANARFVEQAGVGRVAAVALRDSDAVALVKVSGAGAGAYSVVRNVGPCPTDVWRDASTLWVAVSNQRCVSDYATLGAAYVVWVPDAAPGARESIALGVSARGAASTIVRSDTAYVLTIGVTAFGGNTPTPAAVSRVDMRRRQLINTVLVPSALLGTTMHLGADGRLYLSAYTSSDFSEQRVFALDPTSMSYVGEREAGKDFLRLRTLEGNAANCTAATADARGNVYCTETAVSGASRLLVFGPDGTQIRSAPAGQGAIDLALRF